MNIMEKAIHNKIGMRKIMAKKIATFIMDTFGYELRIIDNILNPNERQIFYMLQSEGFLTTCREQTRLYDGREWVTHYWELNYANIFKFTKLEEEKTATITSKKLDKKPDRITIYSEISDEMWNTRRIFDHGIPQNY